jgi:hypothetical protein
MREALNSNPLVQAAVIGVLLLGTAFFIISTTGSGGKEESEAAPTTTSVSTTATAPATPPPASPAGAAPTSGLATALSGGQAAPAAPPLPRPVLRAWKANETLVLLFVRDGGIDDRLAKRAALGVAGFRDVALFVVPAHRIYRYAAVGEGVGVERTPALVVVTPKNLDKSVPTASVSYGFQSPQSVAQAVVDAGYKGPTVDYHP